MAILTDAEHDARIQLGPANDYRLYYNFHASTGKSFVFPLAAQRLIYYVFNETEDVAEVHERLCKFLGHSKEALSLIVLQAVIRTIDASCGPLKGNYEEEREKDRKEQKEVKSVLAHWRDVMSLQASQLSGTEKSAGVAALTSRMIQSFSPEEGFIIKCNGGPKPITERVLQSGLIVFEPIHQAFIYNAMEFERLNSQDTAVAFENKFATPTARHHVERHHVRRGFRFINYRHSIVVSGTEEANHWGNVRQDRGDVRAEIRRLAPVQYGFQSVPGYPVPQNVYQGQSSSTGFAGFSAMPMPHSDFLNQQLVDQTSWEPKAKQYDLGPEPLETNPESWLPPRRSGQSLGFLQPAAEPRRSHPTNPDPRSSQTTEPPKKRHAEHTLDSPSSNSSNDNPRGDDERQTSTKRLYPSLEALEADKQADLQRMKTAHDNVRQAFWNRENQDTAEGQKELEVIEAKLAEFAEGTRIFWESRLREYHYLDSLEEQSHAQKSSKKGGQREHRGTKRSTGGEEGRALGERGQEDRGQGGRTNVAPDDGGMDFNWKPPPGQSLGKSVENTRRQEELRHSESQKPREETIGQAAPSKPVVQQSPAKKEATARKKEVKPKAPKGGAAEVKKTSTGRKRHG